MKKEKICLLIIGFLTWIGTAEAQNYQLSTSRNKVANLEVSVQKNDSKDVQLKLVNEGIKSAESAKINKKTGKFAETWAILAYLYSYKLSIDNNIDTEEWLYRTQSTLDTAISFDKENTNLKYNNATEHNLVLKKVQLAQSAFNNRDYEKALNIYTRLSNKYPKDTLYAINGAVAANYLQRRSEGIELMKRAVENDAKNAAIYQTLGNWYAVRQETNLAIATYEKGLEFNPNHTFLNNEYINVLLDNKLYNKAEAALAQKLVAFANVDKMNYLYAYVNQQLNNLNEAINYYNKAIAINSYYFDAYYQLGLTYVDLFKTEKKVNYLNSAIANIENAHDLKPNDTQTIKLLIQLYTFTERKDKVRSLNKKLAEL